MLFTDWVVLILLLTMIVFPTQIIYFIALLFFRIKERNPEMAFYQKDLVEKLMILSESQVWSKIIFLVP